MDEGAVKLAAMAQTDDYRAASRQAWASVADTWGELIGRIDVQLAPAADWMIRAAALRPGETVLELAGGPGTISLMAADAVGEAGRVICTDFAEEMVDTARRRAEAEGVANLEFRTMDAESIDLPDESVDVVLCRMGLMLMADPLAAVRESARVLRGGGRLAVSVWAEAPANPWVALPMKAIAEHFAAPPPPEDAPGMFVLADPDRLTGMFREAGLEDVHSDLINDHVEYASVEDLVDTMARVAGPLRALMENLDAEARVALTERIRAEVAHFVKDDGSLILPDRILAAAGRRP